MTPGQIHNMLMHPMFCRLVGFLSSVVGLLCHALSSSFRHLFGEWNLLKIFLYILLSFIISSIMLFAKKWNLPRSFLLRVHVGFLVLMLTSLYSFFYDKAVNGKPDTLSLISCGAFALMSLCMSRQINLGFEVSLLNYFLGCLNIYLMKINLMLAFVGAAFSYSFIILRSSLESQPETRTITVSDHIAVQINTTNREERVADGNSGFSSDYSNHPQQLQSLHKRKREGGNEDISAPGSRIATEPKIVIRTISEVDVLDDGYRWRKNGQKAMKGNPHVRSYYSCAYSECPVRKHIERALDDPRAVITTYKGNHSHGAPGAPGRISHSVNIALPNNNSTDSHCH